MNKRKNQMLVLIVGALWVWWATRKKKEDDDMGLFFTGDRHSSSEYDISASISELENAPKSEVLSPPITDAEIKEARVARDRRLKQELADRVAATNKSSVKIGSLPRIPPWLLHLALAIAAAGVVHLVIHFYGR